MRFLPLAQDARLRPASAQSVLFGRMDNWLVQFGKSFELHIQGLHAQSEQPRRPGLAAAALPQRRRDQLALEIVNDLWQVDAVRRN